MGAPGYGHFDRSSLRAADSIATNIAEGCGAQTSNRELARFLDMAIKSASETENHLIGVAISGLMSRGGLAATLQRDDRDPQNDLRYRKRVLESESPSVALRLCGLTGSSSRLMLTAISRGRARCPIRDVSRGDPATQEPGRFAPFPSTPYFLPSVTRASRAHQRHELDAGRALPRSRRPRRPSARQHRTAQPPPPHRRLHPPRARRRGSGGAAGDSGVPRRRLRRDALFPRVPGLHLAARRHTSQRRARHPRQHGAQWVQADPRRQRPRREQRGAAVGS